MCACTCVSMYLCVSACLNHCVSCRGGGGPGGCRHPHRVNRAAWASWFWARRKGLQLGEGCTPLPATLTLPGLLQKAPSASDSDSKAESDAAKAEPVPPVRSPSSSSASSSSSSSDSEVSVKKPPRGRKPGGFAGGAARGLGLGLAWWGWVGLGEALQEMNLPPQMRASLPLFSSAAEKPPPKPRGRKPKPERPPTSSSSDRWVQGLGRGAGGGWVRGPG